jgi:hypothetical protein
LNGRLRSLTWCGTRAINATNNLATGLTVVSGSHLVSFEGTINALGNPSAGVSVNSKPGLDVDPASVRKLIRAGEQVATLR